MSVMRGGADFECTAGHFRVGPKPDISTQLQLYAGWTVRRRGIDMPSVGLDVRGRAGY